MASRIYTAKIKAATEEFSLDIPHRDWMLLAGPREFIKGGQEFVSALGVFENYTVARGIPENSTATRKRAILMHSATILLSTIQDYEDLLSCDYSYEFAAEGGIRGSGKRSGFHIRGYAGSINATPKGFCTVQLREPGPCRSRIVEILDVRNRKTLETDDRGQLTIRRRKAIVTWNVLLPPLIKFLKTQQCDELVIQHD